MELEGKVIFVGEEKNGMSQSTGKQWRRNEFVIETQEQYPKKCCFITFNDTCNIIPAAGVVVKVSFDIDAREWNGKYYNDIRAYKIETAGQQAIQQAVSSQQPQPTAEPQPTTGTKPIVPTNNEPEEKTEDLPF